MYSFELVLLMGFILWSHSFQVTVVYLYYLKSIDNLLFYSEYSKLLLLICNHVLLLLISFILIYILL